MTKSGLYERFYGEKRKTFDSYNYAKKGTLSDVHLASLPSAHICTKDYSWNIHGYSETLNFFPELASKTSEAHDHIVNFTLER